MKAKSILLILILFTGLLSIQAQNRNGAEGRKRFDIEQVKEKQAEFLKKELELTDTEMKNFIPLANEWMDKKFELNRAVRREARELRKKANKTDADYQRVIDAFLNSKIKEAELQKEYFQKFKSVLPAEKVFKYQQAEMQFMQRAVEGNQQRRREGQPNK